MRTFHVARGGQGPARPAGVPEERLKIAQRFIAGLMGGEGRVPQGRKKSHARLGRPCGTRPVWPRCPVMNRWAIFIRPCGTGGHAVALRPAFRKRRLIERIGSHTVSRNLNDMAAENKSVPPEAAPDWRAEASALWRQLPQRGLFFGLLAVWVVFFHFLGNSTLGYVNTASLFGWFKWVQSVSSEEAHTWFMPLVVAVLFWWKRAELMAVPKQIWWPALGLFVVALLLHVVGFMVQQTRISFAAFFIGIYALSGLVWGWKWWQATFFPFFLFAFAMPLGNTAEVVTVPLRMLATKLAVFTSHTVLQINVIQQGASIISPTGKYQYEVVAACSGIRSLTAILALSTIFSFMMFKSNWRRAAMIGAAVPLAVAGNVVRLMTIIIAAEAVDAKAGNYVHENTWFSLIPYVPAIIGLLLLGRWLEEKKEVVPKP